MSFGNHKNCVDDAEISRLNIKDLEEKCLQKINFERMEDAAI